MRVGIDLDNTIVAYDHVFAAAAEEMGLIGPGEAHGKAELRRLLRQRGDEQDWQRVQGQVYGRFMPLATMMPGLEGFLMACRARSVRLFIVSHKTRFGHFDEARIDLRAAAWSWLEAKGFFAEDGFALSAEDVFFEDDRDAKVARIAALGLGHFIDDLPEVLADSAFPAATARLLFAPDGSRPEGPFSVHAHWDSITREVLGD